MNRRRPIDLHIDELVLPAMPHGGERRLREAVEAELLRALSPHAARLERAHGARREHVDAGPLTFAPSDHAGTVGPRLARQIGQEVIGE